MSLDQYKPQFDNAYQEIFQKVLVAKSVGNFRFEPTLTYGESIERVALDISAVVVRSTTRGSASTIDSVTDSAELLTINLEKEAAFHISDGEVKQAGPLNPGAVIGAKIAHLVAQDFDARFFGEVLNADNTFDTGDLTTLASNGTPFVLSSTTVPQFVTRAPAKLRSKNNQPLTNLCLVVDSYAASDMEQYLLGKDWNLAEATYKNGYAGTTARAEVYVSENLTSTAVFTFTDVNVDSKTITINGVVFTSEATPTTAGSYDVHATTEDGAAASFAALLNAPGTTTAGTQVAFSAADQATMAGWSAVAALGVVTVTCKGAGALTVSEDEDNGSWGTPVLHAYYGKKGGIDAVLQDIKEVDMRPTADRRGTNVFSSYLGGIKTFDDGSKKFLDVMINAS